MNKFIFWLLILFASYINFIFCLNDKQKQAYLEELKPVFKKLEIVPNDKNQIDQKSMAKIIKYVFGGLDSSGKNLPSTSIEDEFTFIIIKNLLQGKPEYIDVNDIPDILEPKKLEEMTNDMFKNFKLDRVEQMLKEDLKKRKEKAKTKPITEKESNKKTNIEEDKIDL